MLPKTMSGVQLVRHGGPDALIWNDQIPLPQPGPGMILVKVSAAGVNNTDINTRIGWYSSNNTDGTGETGLKPNIKSGGWSGGIEFPLIQGGDLCGKVAALGDGVAQFSIGQRVTCPLVLPRPTTDAPFGCIVLGSELDGAFAQYCAVPEDDLFDVTASPLSDTEIAAIPCAFGTAENMLTRAGVSRGHHVLVTGASGGVGLAAVQLAKLRGAKVTGVCAAAKSGAVRSAGATGILGKTDIPAKASFDVVIDVVGGPAWSGLILALKRGGQIAVSGAIAGPVAEIDLRDIYLSDITIHGCTFQPPDIFPRLVGLINRGEIRPLVSQTYPMRDIGKAQEDFMSKRFPGKLVLIPPDAP